MENKLFKDKRGITLASVLEIMLFSVLFVAALTAVGVSLNTAFSENKDLTYGLVSNTTQKNLESLQDSMESSRLQGQSGISSLGIFTLTTLPQMIFTILGMTIEFIVGGWINSLVGLMNLGAIAGTVIIVLKLLYYFFLIFVLIKLLTRSNTV